MESVGPRGLALLIACGCGESFVAGGTTSGAVGQGGAGGAGGDPVVGVGTGPESGAGGGCAALWFCDADEDGWGDDQKAVVSCTQPPPGVEGCAGPYVGLGEDCAPADARAFPTQRGYFATPIDPPIYASSTYDFNCDGVAEKNPAQLFNQDGVVTCQPDDCAMRAAGFSVAASCGGTTNYYRCESVATCEAVAVLPAAPLGCR